MENSYEFSPPRLKEAIEESRLSVREVSQLCGMTRASIYNLMAGTIKYVRIPTLIKIADVLHVDPNWLMNQNVPKQPETDKHKELVDQITEYLRFLTQEELESIGDLAKAYKDKGNNR